MEFRYIRRAASIRRTRAVAADRRRQDRLGNCPPLSVSGLAAAVYDVSRTGVSLLVQEPLRIGDRFHLVLTDTMDQTTLSVDAEVIWCRQGRAGLRWLELSLEQDMWLLNHFQTWFRQMDGASRR